jgi:hypothetical protein
VIRVTPALCAPSQAHGWYGWRRAGWTVEAVDLAAETVTFARPGGGA